MGPPSWGASAPCHRSDAPSWTSDGPPEAPPRPRQPRGWPSDGPRGQRDCCEHGHGQQKNRQAFGRLNVWPTSSHLISMGARAQGGYAQTGQLEPGEMAQRARGGQAVGRNGLAGQWRRRGAGSMTTSPMPRPNARRPARAKHLRRAHAQSFYLGRRALPRIAPGGQGQGPAATHARRPGPRGHCPCLRALSASVMELGGVVALACSRPGA